MMTANQAVREPKDFKVMTRNFLKSSGFWRKVAGLVLVATVAVIAFGVAPVLAASSAASPAMPCETREGYIPVTGGRVWYQIVGEGGAVPLLVLHGGPGAPHDYLEPIAGLCHERPVIFYDQLGCGKSDRPADKSLWRIERFVKELGEVRSGLGLKRVHILGHSWGSMLLTDYALTRPDGLESLIFSDPLCSVQLYLKEVARLKSELPTHIQRVIDRHEKLGSTQCWEYQGALLAFYKGHFCRLDIWPDPLERTLIGFNEEIYETMQGQTEWQFTGNLKDWERVDRLHEIKLPTLYLCGRYDEVTPQGTQICKNEVPGAEMVVFEQSSHTPMLEEPERYRQVVSDFIKRAEARYP
jgi:proline iminopeptidase